MSRHDGGPTLLVNVSPYLLDTQGAYDWAREQLTQQLVRWDPGLVAYRGDGVRELVEGLPWVAKALPRLARWNAQGDVAYCMCPGHFQWWSEATWRADGVTELPPKGPLRDERWRACGIALYAHPYPQRIVVELRAPWDPEPWMLPAPDYAATYSGPPPR